MLTSECGRRGAGMLQFECPRRVQCEVLGTLVLVLDRSTTLRQGHSEASG